MKTAIWRRNVSGSSTAPTTAARTLIRQALEHAKQGGVWWEWLDPSRIMDMRPCPALTDGHLIPALVRATTPREGAQAVLSRLWHDAEPLPDDLRKLVGERDVRSYAALAQHLRRDLEQNSRAPGRPTKFGDRMIPISVNMPASWLDEFSRQAERHGLTRAEAMRDAVAMAIKYWQSAEGITTEDAHGRNTDEHDTRPDPFFDGTSPPHGGGVRADGWATPQYDTKVTPPEPVAHVERRSVIR